MYKVTFGTNKLKMIRHSLLFAFGLTAFGVFSQKATDHSCSSVKSKHALAKSATLTPQQIAQTERYDVHFYALDIEMDNLTTYVAGTGEIHGKSKEALDSVWFELFRTFTISEIRLNGTPVTYNRQASAIKVPVNIPAGTSFAIAVDYNGTPPTAATNPLGGAGMSNATSPSWGNRVTWSLSEPFSAYEWWPCKQSLRDKADSVSIKVTVPSTCKAGSNGVLENVVNVGNGKSRYEWKHRHPIDYYLISVAVAEYIEYNVYANPAGAPAPILIQNFIYNNPGTLPNFQADIDETADFLEYFSEIYGLYPFHDEKYGHCMAPLSGGMEHQTMTTQGFFENTLTAHELAHQWWGDHVTCASWADIWVNEGFASYSEYLMLAEMYPGQQNADMNSRHQNIMSQPGGSVWVQDSLNENAIFSGRLTYNKGAAIVHTMRFIMNNDTLFFQALRNYQEDFADSVAVGTDVQHALEEVSSIDFAPVFEQWYYGEGFPTYSAAWNVIGNDLHLKVTHTASVPSVTPVFTNPLEIRFSRTGAADTIIRFSIDANTSVFILPNSGNIAGITSIDPNNWIINRTGSIQHDTNLNLLGLEEAVSEMAAKIYPNPTEGAVTIELPEAGNYTLKVFDTKGRFMFEKQFNQHTSVDLGEFSNGLYMIQIESANGSQKIRRILRK